MFILQFSFEATIGRNYAGGIAVDDVTLSNGLCEGEREPQNNRQGSNVACTTVGNLFQSLSRINVFLNEEWIILSNHARPSAILKGVTTNYISVFICVSFIFQGNCNFDSSFCLWKNDLSFSFSWTRRRYDTPSWQTGPSADHTSGDVSCNSHSCRYPIVE